MLSQGGDSVQRPQRVCCGTLRRMNRMNGYLQDDLESPTPPWSFLFGLGAMAAGLLCLFAFSNATRCVALFRVRGRMANNKKATERRDGELLKCRASDVFDKACVGSQDRWRVARSGRGGVKACMLSGPEAAHTAQWDKDPKYHTHITDFTSYTTKVGLLLSHHMVQKQFHQWTRSHSKGFHPE